MNCIRPAQSRPLRSFSSHVLLILPSISRARAYGSSYHKKKSRRETEIRKELEKPQRELGDYIDEAYDNALAEAAKETSFYSRWSLRIKAFRAVEGWVNDYELSIRWKKSVFEALHHTHPLHRKCLYIVRRLNAELSEEENFRVDVKDAMNLDAHAMADRSIEIGSQCARCQDDMVAHVLAHEISHVILEHLNKIRGIYTLAHRRRNQAKLLFSAFPLLFKKESGKLNYLALILRSKLMGPSRFSLLKDKRSQEYEADYLSIKLMMRAGFDPEGAIKWYEMCNPNYKEEDAEMTREQYIIRTHPTTTQRIRKIQEVIQQEKRKVFTAEKLPKMKPK